MLLNGPESLAESKPLSQPASGGRRTRALPDGQSAPAKSAAPRRRRDRQESSNTSAEQRFFLAGEDGKGGVPVLGRECPNEAEAIIEAFRAQGEFLSHHRISDPGGHPFVWRADLEEGGFKKE
jgi:hypothetical protein